MGAGWEVSLSSSPCLPALSSATGSLFMGCGEEDACALGAFERGVLGLEIREWTRTKTHSRRGANARTLNGVRAPASPI